MPTPPTAEELNAFRKRVVQHNGYLLRCIESLQRRGFHRQHVFFANVVKAQAACDVLAAYLNGAELIDRFRTEGVDRLLRELHPEVADHGPASRPPAQQPRAEEQAGGEEGEGGED